MIAYLVLTFLTPAFSFDPFALGFEDLELMDLQEKDVGLKNIDLERDAVLKNLGFEKDVELKNLALERDVELKSQQLKQLKKLPPYGIPLLPPDVAAKELAAEGIAKEFSFEKAWPWLSKEFAFEEGAGYGIGIGKEMEIEKILGFGIGKEIGFERAAYFPWAAWEKYFGLTKRLTFEQALALELFKRYNYYGFWIALELRRRFALAKQLGLVGQEIAFQEAINLGLFKGIGLDKMFEAALKAIGVEKTAAAAKEFSFEKFFGPWRR